ncbi:hypothetical protein D3C85_1187310 [compost metagenome]
MEPQATKVPAEKKLMKSDKPPMNQGTASPPAKNDFKLRPVRENNRPINMINTENTTITEVSINEFILN